MFIGNYTWCSGESETKVCAEDCRHAKTWSRDILWSQCHCTEEVLYACTMAMAEDALQTSYLVSWHCVRALVVGRDSLRIGMLSRPNIAKDQIVPQQIRKGLLGYESVRVQPLGV